MSSKKLYFFAEGNTKMGRGHISRCLAIAAMIDDLVNIHFVCLDSNFSFVKDLVQPYGVFGLTSYQEVSTIVTSEDLVWIDNYDIDDDVKADLSNLASKIIETNDIPYDNRHIDIMVNHTPGISSSLFHNDSKCQYFLGLDYSLLRPNFLQYARDHSSHTSGEGIFVCFGGADTYGLGYNFVSGLIESNFDKHIYWVKSSNQDEIVSDQVTILEHLSEQEMIKYMLKAKVLLIPSSVLSFEAIALRKPIYTTNFVSNQDLIFQGLMDLNLASGTHTIKTRYQVKVALTKLITYYDNRELHLEQQSNQAEFLDGQSQYRIRAILEKIITE